MIITESSGSVADSGSRRIIANEEEYERVKNHMLLSNLGLWAWKCGKIAPMLVNHGGCHYGAMPLFKDKRTFQWFASCASYGPKNIYNQPNNPAFKDLPRYTEEYLQWLFSPQSPWASVHGNEVELIRYEGIIRGFILGPNALKNASGASIYNLLIASRQVRDHPQLFINYGDLKEKCGLDDFTAFILAPYFQLSKNIWVKGNSSHQSAHTPLKESVAIGGNYDFKSSRNLKPSEMKYSTVLDLKALKRSEYNTKTGSVSQSSHGWMKKYKDGDIVLSILCDEGTSINTKFSTLPSVSEEAIVKVAKQINDYIHSDEKKEAA